jgi:hypothetical protein
MKNKKHETAKWRKLITTLTFTDNNILSLIQFFINHSTPMKESNLHKLRSNITKSYCKIMSYAYPQILFRWQSYCTSQGHSSCLTKPILLYWAGIRILFSTSPLHGRPHSSEDRKLSLQGHDEPPTERIKRLNA